MFDTLRTTHDLAGQHLCAYQDAVIRVHDQQRLGAPYQTLDTVWLNQVFRLEDCPLNSICNGWDRFIESGMIVQTDL